MDLINFNKKLTKINALTDNASEGGHLSMLERDLLLSYIRELYEIACDEKPVSATRHQIISHPKQPDEKISESAKSIEKPISPIIPEPVMQQKEVIFEEEKPKTSPVIHHHKSEKEESVKTHVSVAQAAIQKKNLEPVTLDELFADEKINDLSDKISLSSVKDLTKSMGINERIFNQQELFGNNPAHFNESLEGLNNCQSFEEAKQYLIQNVIYRNDWVSETKSKKAATFIKLIKRKFV